MKSEISILLADGQTIVRKGLKLLIGLNKAFTPMIDEASDGNEVISLISKNKYDILILDLNLPKKDGLTIIRKLKKEKCTTPILVLSSNQEENIIMHALDCGAMGYILKNSEPEELIKAIITVVRGARFYCNEVAQIVIGSKDRNKKELKCTDSLSKREKEVLEFISKGFKNKEIAESLKLSPRTIEHHRNNIRSKLEIETTSGLVKFVLENNYFQNS